MVKTLYLLRHGKSSWAYPQLAEHDRPLKKRGRKAARRMGAEMAARRWLPDLILCSTAKRARQTFKHWRKGLWESGTDASKIVYEEDLYLASADRLLDRARRLDDALSSVLFLGHNTGLGDLVGMLSQPKNMDKGFEGGAVLPTAALAVIDLSCGAWDELASGSAHLSALIRPRTLS